MVRHANCISKINPSALIMKVSESKRCSESWDVEWKGHRASLYRKHCRRKTNHPSGKCWQHRPYEYSSLKLENPKNQEEV